MTRLAAILFATVAAGGLCAWWASAGETKVPAPPAPAAPARQWEYKFIEGNATEADLNRLGDDGWELVAGITESPTGRIHIPSRLFFKRPKQAVAK
jgi:hypothetical protein